MPGLKNAQRISYKATYNQISATALAKRSTDDPKTKLSRAIEKAAFVQSLGIVAAELASVQELALRAAQASGGQADAIAGAIAATERLIADGSGTSTLNNAHLFAAIAPETLVLIAEQLVPHRQTIAEAVNKSVAGILSAYRSVLAPPPSKPAESSKGTKAPGSAEPRTTTSDAGLPTLTTLSARKTTSVPNAAVEVRSYSARGGIDETKAVPAAYSSVLAAEADAVAYTPSNDDAIIWAEKQEPRQFARLVDQLQPYLLLSADERTAVGGARALIDLLKGRFSTIFKPGPVKGSIAGFQTRMTVEPVGNLHLERIEMYPVGVERGELVHSLPLAPGETVNISHKEWSVTEREFEDLVQDSFEGYSEQGVAEKTDIAMSNDSQSQHATALNVGASLSASYSSVTLSTSFGYNATTNDTRSRKDSRNHSMEITKKASGRTKKDHKVTFKVTSVAGSEDQSVRVISNASPTDSMRIDYFQLARKWKIDLLRYGLRMTYDIVIPNPGAGIVAMVRDVQALDALINTPFSFTLPLSAIYYNSLAADPHAISNYDQLAAQFNATVAAPPEAQKWVNVHKETAEVNDYDHVHFDSIDFEIDENFYIHSFQMEFDYQTNSGESNDYFRMLAGETTSAGIAKLIGKSGHLSLDLTYQYLYNFAINITFLCRPKVQVLLDWRLQAWNQLRQAAEDEYSRNLQNYKDQQVELVRQIADYDALTLRRMEREEIMKGVLRWILGPQFYLVPFDIASLFGADSNDPSVQDVLDPNRLSEAEWIDVMERGEFVKYVHNAIEWENVLYFTYPYFWDDTKLWDFKKFLYHPDSTHRTFLRSGAARVVLTIRPGFEPSFTSLMETGAFNALPGPHPYVTIAQEIQDFANTNYPGFPPANPEQDARPLLYLEQRRTWKEMQFVIQLLDASKAETGAYPEDGGTNTVPAAALTPYLDGPITINGTSYAGVNDYNAQANTAQLALDPTTPQEALLPTYAAVPVDDGWNTPYFYKCPGDSGDYDLISHGANAQPGGTDKNADIAASSEASLISTWFEYTPINAMDIGVTMNAPNAVPPQPSPEIA